MKVNSHVLFECQLEPLKILEALPTNELCSGHFRASFTALISQMANTKTHPFVHNTHKYFPKVGNICVRKALFYQRTGCSDKLNILRIIICTYQGSHCEAFYPALRKR